MEPPCGRFEIEIFKRERFAKIVFSKGRGGHSVVLEDSALFASSGYGAIFKVTARHITGKKKLRPS